MSNRIRAHWASLFLIAGVAACSHTSTATPRPDLAGQWSLDRAASDSLKGSRDRKIGLRGRAYFGPDGMVQPGYDARLLEDVRDSWVWKDSPLRIVVRDVDVRIIYSDSAELIVPTNGDSHLQRFRDFDVKSKGKWKDGALRVQHDFGRVRVLEQITRSGNRMRVDTRILSGFRPLEFGRIYTQP